MTVLQQSPPVVAKTLPKLREYQPDPVASRFGVAFAVRESDEKNRSMFGGMCDQTYNPYRGDPWIAALMAARLAPLDAEDSFMIEVGLPEGDRRVEVVVDRTWRNGTMVISFRTGPYSHVWAMSSAAKVNLEGDNDFTQIFVDLVRKWRPQVLVVASVSRLVRSVTEGGLVTNVVPKFVDQVWVGGYHLMEMVGPNATFGIQALSQQAGSAAMERDAIVSRTVAGRVGKARGGLWPYGNTSVPFGYQLEPRTRRLLPVAQLRDRVRAMLLALGDDSAPSVIVDRLANLKIPSRRATNPGLLAHQAQARTNPRALVDSLLSWAPLWVNGEHLYRFACPYRGLTEMNGAPVVTRENDPHDRGETQVLLVPGTPEGGWAEEAVLHRVSQMAALRLGVQLDAGVNAAERPLHPRIEAEAAGPDLLRAVQRATRKGPRRGEASPRKRGTATVAPFSGFSWRDENGLYELKVAKGAYKVERRAWADLSSVVDSGLR